MSLAELLRSGNWRGAFRKITVEPALLMYMLSSWYTGLTLQSLFLYKVCLNDGLGSSVCDPLLLNSSYRGSTNETTGSASINSTVKDVETESSRWFFYQTIAFVIPSVLISLFLGTWSDNYGRKLPLLLPPIGGFVSTAVTLAMAYGPLLPSHQGYLLVASFIGGCFGGYATMLMATYSYLSAVTEPGEKTIRYSLLEAMSVLASVIGSFTQGVVLDFGGDLEKGFLAALVIIMVLQLMAFAYTLLLVKNVHIEELHVQESPGYRCRMFFSTAGLIEGFRTLAKYREYSRRVDLHLLVSAFFLVILGYLGYVDVLYLFSHSRSVTRSELGYFNGFTSAIAFFGTVVGALVLKQRFSWHDKSLVVLGNASFVVLLLSLALAGSHWVAQGVFRAVFWTAPVFGLFRPLSIGTLRSQCSALVDIDEQGKLFAIMGAGENLLQLVASLFFNYILWPLTLDVWIGSSFATSACLSAVAAALVVVSQWHMRRADCYHDILAQSLTATEGGIDESDFKKPLSW